MNLIITDIGDESVGIFSTSYTLETPVDVSDDLDEMESFRQLAINLYCEFSFGRVIAFYDFELEDMAENEKQALQMSDEAYENAISGVSDDHPSFE